MKAGDIIERAKQAPYVLVEQHARGWLIFNLGDQCFRVIPEEWIFDDRRTGRYHAGG